MAIYAGFQASNGQFVTAEDGGGRELRANRNDLRGWETFRINDVDEGGLSNNNVINLIAVNGQYVAAEGGGGGLLNANRLAASGWEAFTIKKKQGDGPIADGDEIGLVASNGQFVSAVDGGSRELIANRNDFLGWETFRIKFVDAPPASIQTDAFKSKLEELARNALAQGNRKQATIERFDVNGSVVEYRIKLRHHQVADTFLGSITVYDVTNSLEGSFDTSNPTTLANTQVCVDLPSLVVTIIGQRNVCMSLAVLAALL